VSYARHFYLIMGTNTANRSGLSKMKVFGYLSLVAAVSAMATGSREYLINTYLCTLCPLNSGMILAA